jgi:NADPH-dependent 2,4-dienoyl-CoA reductase/sulfur reductase-like enzyme/rhodanese-related sulfurtransferase
MEKKSDIVIIGGVAAGPKTAATLMRRNPKLKVTLFQKEERLSYATCGMPYFASGDVGSFKELNQTGYGVVRDESFFEQTKGFKAVTQSEVIKINRKEKTVTVKNIKSGETYEHGYGKLVIATGAHPVRPPFPIENNPNIRNFVTPDDAVHFRKLAQTGQVEKVAVIGGGFIGCEVAEAAAGLWGIETTIIEREDQLLPYVLDPEMSALAKKEMIDQGVNVHTSVSVSEIKNTEDSIEVVLDKGDKVTSDEVTCDYVFLCIGVRPEVALAQDCGLELGTTGGIKVNSKMQTSDPDIYAGGDCVESINQLTGKEIYIPMGSLANRHGRVIAENITGFACEFPGVLGAFLVKVFDRNVGSVGLNMNSAKNAGYDCRAVWGAFTDKPDYYPESESMFLKMIYDSNTMQLLGLQAVGKGDICRRIDVFSSLLQHKSKVNDLLNFEHGYAPPYAEALDPLYHMAGIALAQEKGITFSGPGEDFSKYDDSVWLDVREEDEVESAPLNPIIDKGTVFNIPLDDLRNSLDKLDQNKNIVVICRRGPRSYQAALILKAAGFDKVQVIAGGTTGIV